MTKPKRSDRTFAASPIRPLTPGDRVLVLPPHPWATHAGSLIAYERYGLGWYGWRVALDGGVGECYAKPSELRRTGTGGAR